MSAYYNHQNFQIDSMIENYNLNIKKFIDSEQNLAPMSSLQMILSPRDCKRNTQLMLCIIHENPKSFDFIIQQIKTANLSERNTFLNERNVYGHTALHLSLIFRNKNMLQKLIEIGCNPLTTDTELKNAYHYIAYSNLLGFTKVINESLLTTYGNTGRNQIEANLVSSKDSEGFTPIHLAIERHQHIKLLSELVDPIINGGGIECIFIRTGKCSSTALHLATNTGNVQLIEFILLRVPYYMKIDFINEESGQGNTALHIAVSTNNLESVETLLKHGASLEVINAEDDRPIDYCDSEEMRNLLLSHH